ncbi:hypothetical protein JDV02_006463 [Purpureocillium takamizusanense]|uniref:Killer toxin Kp4 domain-containing protein n=1 Tax=Purpureocillium takamizusanense TaxID=2060973 RepID=A0A9Q8QKB1_9HYPO|nr:uncharacterized protein JDV02_006463 [Purpureocillium takamizusanense]UNI20369.1 hypothetical protein JDV02_006463 [Purpureocillium takamizusanense]
MRFFLPVLALLLRQCLATEDSHPSHGARNSECDFKSPLCAGIPLHGLNPYVVAVSQLPELGQRFENERLIACFDNGREVRGGRCLFFREMKGGYGTLKQLKEMLGDIANGCRSCGTQWARERDRSDKKGMLKLDWVDERDSCEGLCYRHLPAPLPIPGLFTWPRQKNTGLNTS